MNQEIIKPGLVRKIVDKLDDKRIVVGGNKEFYKSKYHLQYTQEIVDNVISAFLQTMEDIIEDGDGIRLNGYMTIKPTYRNARYGRNVYSNKEMTIPERYRIKFNAGNRLTDACDRLYEKSREEVENE